MKKRSVLLSIALSLVLVLTLGACGSSASSEAPVEAEEAAAEEAPDEESPAEEEPKEESSLEVIPENEETGENEAVVRELTEATDPLLSEETETFPVEGEYTVFGMRNEGLLAEASALGLSSSLTLNESGGSMTMDEDSMEIKEWTRAGDIITIVMADNSSADGTIHDGIIELDIYGTGDLVLYYAREGADISSYELLSPEDLLQKISEREKENAPDSKTGSLLKAIDPAAGAHLNYSVRNDYMDSVRDYDVHEKDGVFYSFRTLNVAGYKDSIATFFKDGAAYTLYPEQKTGILATESSSTILKNNILMLDDLYKLISTRGVRTDFTTGTREVGGVTYEVEVFPAESEYETETAFYYDSEGRLAYCLESAQVVDTMELGESFYTINVIDDAVDETLFDISGYTIE